jgi:spermidine synthase
MNRWLLRALAFTSGFAVMAAEMAAGRLLGLFYGTSTLVWSLLIGAVMAALAVGGVLGGRLATRQRAVTKLAGALLLAAVLLAALPFVAKPLMAATLDWFDAGSFVLLGGSAAATLLLLALPITLLGMTGPVLIRSGVGSDVEATGPVAGSVYAWGTAGSLLGTYAAGVVLVPLVGTTRAFLLGAALLAAVAIFALWTRRGAAVGAVALLAAAFAVPTGPIKPAGAAPVLFESESVYNYVRVEQRGAARWLLLGDGYARQTVHRDDGEPHLRGVWRHYAAAPSYTSTGSPSRVLMLGLGGGGAAHAYAALYPDASVTGVELDPEVVRAGREFMGLPASTNVVLGDARAFVRRPGATFDVIILDAFQFPYVPYHLTTREFFDAVAARLAPGGVLMVNAGRFGDDRAVVDALAVTLAAVFPRVDGVDEGLVNTILVAARHPSSEDKGLDALELDPYVSRLRGRRAKRWVPAAGAPVLTDERAPVEWLTDMVVLRTVLGG